MSTSHLLCTCPQRAEGAWRKASHHDAWLDLKSLWAPWHFCGIPSRRHAPTSKGVRLLHTFLLSFSKPPSSQLMFYSFILISLRHWKRSLLACHHQMHQRSCVCTICSAFCPDTRMGHPSSYPSPSHPPATWLLQPSLSPGLLLSAYTFYGVPLFKQVLP